MEKEELNLIKRIEELAQKAYYKGIRTYTDFLNLNEISIFHSMGKKFQDMHYILYGGYEDAERKMLCFLGDMGESIKDKMNQSDEMKEQMPIVCLMISPVNEKFAPELTHRDYLGAILNTGTSRSKIGDICIDNKRAYCYCTPPIGKFLEQELSCIKHTKVTAKITENPDFNPAKPLRELTQSVSSLRLDAVTALAFHESRGKIASLIEGEKVFINGKLTVSNSALLKPGDIVSVRGHGRYRFDQEGSITKKGRIYVHLLLYQR